MQTPTLSVSQFIATCNQTLEYAFPSIQIVGEVASFKVNQGKWVFFDLKDEESSINCFMTVYSLRIPLQDGMKVVVRATPKMTKWGKFSLTVTAIQPVGEGNIKKSFELLKKKLEAEGLFDPAKKRPIPDDLTKIGVISSTSAAGYGDFIKIINARWGGLDIQVAHTQVQGLSAPDQIIRALRYFNERADVQMIAIMRGGGSADDLSCFNDELLAREIAASRIPVITGIGHEQDISLADLVADVRGSTPSNVAEMLTPDRNEKIQQIHRAKTDMSKQIKLQIETSRRQVKNNILTINKQISGQIAILKTRIQDKMSECREIILRKIRENQIHVKQTIRTIEGLNPNLILKQGYAIISGKLAPGDIIKITTFEKEIEAEIKQVKERE